MDIPKDDDPEEMLPPQELQGQSGTLATAWCHHAEPAPSGKLQPTCGKVRRNNHIPSTLDPITKSSSWWMMIQLTCKTLTPTAETLYRIPKTPRRPLLEDVELQDIAQELWGRAFRFACT